MLSDFVSRTLGDRFDWGTNNCALWSADAVLHCTGIDPAEAFREECTDWASCRRLIIRSGGLRRLVTDAMDRLGFHDLDGDGVALARADGAILCGIVLDGRLICKTDRGGRIHDAFDLIRGWSWPRL